MYINSSKRSKIRFCLSAALMITAVIVALMTLPGENGTSLGAEAATGDDFIRVLDVGQGDSILISSNGKHMLIDTGLAAGADNLCSKLRGYGVKNLDVLLLTHFHNDHAGGIETVTNRFNVENLIYPDMSKSDQTDSAAVNAKRNVLAEEGNFYVANQGMSIEFGDFEITVIGYYSDMEDENDRSIILMARMGESKFLFAADAESEAENALIEDGINLECDVLKVGHHGSNGSSSEKFLDAANPEFAVISCGAGNPYSHPHTQTLKRLEESNTEIYRTDLSGDITFAVSAYEIEIECEKALE